MATASASGGRRSCIQRVRSSSAVSSVGALVRKRTSDGRAPAASPARRKPRSSSAKPEASRAQPAQTWWREGLMTRSIDLLAEWLSLARATVAARTGPQARTGADRLPDCPPSTRSDPLSDIRIPWAMPYLDDRETDAVVDLLRARRLSMGEQTRRFEEEVAARVGRRHGIAVANGSVALDVAMKLAGVRAGDEVLVSALSYIATVNSVLLQG